MIKQAYNEGHDLAAMKIKDWYTFILQKDDDISCQPIIEIKFPNMNWSLAWRSCFMQSLDSHHTSFAWKLCQRLLPSEERVANTLSKSSHFCRFKCIDSTGGSIISDYEHIFFWCKLSKDVGAWLLNFLCNRTPTSPHDVLNFNLDYDEPLICVIIQTLCFIWDKRINSKEAKVAEFLGKLADRANILRETRFSYIPNNVMDHILIFNNF